MPRRLADEPTVIVKVPMPLSMRVWLEKRGKIALQIRRFVKREMRNERRRVVV